MANIDIDPRLKALSRIKVLSSVVLELAEGFGVSKSTLENILKGINEQALSSIIISYLNFNKRLVGQVTMTIDWDKHRVLASSDNGQSFEVDPSYSISQQISKIYPLLVVHTQKLRQAYQVKEVQVSYVYTNAVWNDSQKLKRIREILNTSPAEELQWEQNSRRTDKNLEVELEYISKRLAELKIKIEHDKP